MRTLFLCVIAFCHAFVCWAQSDVAALTQLKAYARNVHAFNTLFPQEKVYLHLDNTGYFRGETIWFKAYVIRTDSSCYTDLSRVLYVELVAPTGDILTTRKLKIENGQAHGDIKLDMPLMDNGWYEIRAYTRYMTNWNEAGIFSRVIPVLRDKKRPEREGSVYFKPEHEKENEKVLKQWLESSGADLVNHLRYEIPTKEEKKELKKKGDVAKVDFYPEGGSWVKGLCSRIAFSVIPKKEARTGVYTGVLLAANGDTLTRLRTDDEGRGCVVCNPDESPSRLAFRSSDGGFSEFTLPEPVDTGCVLRVDAVSDSSLVRLDFACSSALRGRLLGWTLQHNGNVLRFDTLRMANAPVRRQLDRSACPPGVNQLTLFDRDGRIWAERLFFIHPAMDSYVEEIVIASPDTIRPYGKMDFHLYAAPNRTFSLSVMDAGRLKNGNPSGNVAAWLLLSSELKGFICHPDDYLESADEIHRQATDLLMMVQGWRRYDWQTMAGKKTFVKRQPLEDGLYIDGQIRPRGSHANTEGVDMDVLLMNPDKRRWKWESGYMQTKKDGYFAFRVEDEIEGRWGLVFNTKNAEKAQNYKVLIDRQFSPKLKELTRAETQYLQVDTLVTDAVRPLFEPMDSTLLASRFGKKNRILKEVVVKGKKRKREFSKTARDMEQEKEIQQLPLVYYDVEKLIDDMLDKGEDIPPTLSWIEELPYVQYAMQMEKRSLYAYTMGMARTTLQEVMEGLLPAAVRNLDDVRSIYIETPMGNEKREVIHRSGTYFFNGRWESVPISGKEVRDREARGIYAFIFPRYTFPLKKKGIRQTYFQGYNRPETFQMNNYDEMAPEPDNRRTLYWNPCVTTDSTGRATVTVWNSETCRSLYLSAEGITPGGSPMLYR